MEKDNKIPAIRFKDFDGPWEQCKLGETVQITMGQSPSSINYTDNPNDHILVQGNADMKNGRVLPRVWTTQVTKQAEKGDLILSVRAPVGDIGKTDHDVVLGRGVAGVKGNEFIFQLLEKKKDSGYWRNLSTGSTFDSINSSDIKEASITIPNIKEQEKIGAFFSNLDKLITLHQHKLEKLKIIKNSMLENFFPEGGKNTPNIRFKAFNDTWEQCKLEELVNIGSGRDYKHLKEGTIPVYGTGGYMLSVDEALSYDKDAIGIGRKGTIDNPYILKAPFWTVDTLFYVVPEENNLLEFMYNIFQNINWKKKDESTGVPSLSKRTIENVNVMIPKKEEQEKIGSFFSNLDKLITLHQCNVEKLQIVKKSMLEKMFVE